MARKMTSSSLVSCIFLFGTIASASGALAGSPAFYSCQSAETDPDLVFSVTVQEHDNPRRADVVATFPKANPSVTRYDQVPYFPSASGADHVAYQAEGISVVIYPDPTMLSTVVFGDQGGTQVGLAMRCQILPAHASEPGHHPVNGTPSRRRSVDR